MRISLCVKAIDAPRDPSVVAAYRNGNSETGVVVMFQWNGVGSMSAYMAGERTAPAQPLTLDWGHGIFLRAREKCVRRLPKLKKLGHGSILGRFARSPTIVS